MGPIAGGERPFLVMVPEPQTYQRYEQRYERTITLKLYHSIHMP